jgi:hypothetical protein
VVYYRADEDKYAALMEFYGSGKAEKNLFQCHFFHRKSHVNMVESQATDGHFTLDSTEALHKSTGFSKLAEQRVRGIKSTF